MTPARTRLMLGLAAVAAGLPRPSQAGEGEPLAVVAHAEVSEAGVVGLHAAFRSTSGARLSFWVADPYDGGTSIVFRLLREDGTAYVPWAPAAPRSPVVGAEGSVEPLVGNRERGFSRRTRLFVRELRPDDRRTYVPDRLPPGRYAVHCHYAHPCASVPVRDPDGVLRWTPSAGLFAGTLRAAPTTIEVPEPPTVVVTADLPPAAHQGRWPLTVTVHNRGASSFRLPDSVLVVADGAPGEFVDATARAPGRATAGPAEDDEVSSGGTATFTVELTELTFDTHRHKIRRGRLGDLVGPALVRLEVQLVGGNPTPRSVSPGLWRLVPGPADGEGAGR